MLIESPQELFYVTGGAFLAGWIVARIGASLGNKSRPKERDPRDDRIRSLEAEQRVAQTNADKAACALEDSKKLVEESEDVIKLRETTITEQQELIEQLRIDLKDSVLKTRELRAELSERATENVKSEVKLREVETELSVAQASTDLLATGVLDYTTEDDEITPDRIVKAASGD